MKRYYLANQSKYRMRCRGDQKLIEHYVGVILINPFFDTGISEVQKECHKMYQNNIPIPDEMVELITDTDLNAIDDNDGVIALIYDDELIGTLMEIFYASYVKGMPVYTICYDKRVREHLWVRRYSTKIFKTIDEFIAYAKENREEVL